MHQLYLLMVHQQRRNRIAASKNHLENLTKHFNIVIFENQKAKILDNNNTSCCSHNIKFFNFLKVTIYNG